MRALSFVSFAALALLACAHAAPAPQPVATAPAALVAPPAPAVTPDEPFRGQKPPRLSTEPAFVAPVAVQRHLKNGASVLVVENHALPLVAVEVDVQSGDDREALDKRGLAGFVASMLLEGTKGRSAIDLDIARERLAAELSASSGAESSTVHLNALKETLPDALALLADVLMNPAFKPADIERVRGLILTGLEAKKGNPGALARDDLARELWGEKSPWGLPNGGTPKTIKGITAKDLEHFHKTFYVPNNAVITVSGDVTADEAVLALEKSLANWKKGVLPAKKQVKFPEASARRIVFTDLPSGSQSQVVTGWRAPKPSSPEIVPLMVANNVIGGLFSSRLNLNLREDKAYSYGVRSRLGYFRETSVLVASGGIIATHTADAITEYEKELTRARTDAIGDDELDRAKEAIVAGLPSLLETNDAVAAAFAGLIELGLPLDYYATLPAKVRAVQKAQVVKAIDAEFHPERWPIIVVGPKTVVFDGIKALNIGTVREVAP